MATFEQLADMERLVSMLARMDTPYDGIKDQDKRDDIAAELDDETLCDAAATLYRVIEDAREAMKSQRLRKQKRENASG